jgi:tRNA (mo5U34)-methyltransferase
MDIGDTRGSLWIAADNLRARIVAAKTRLGRIDFEWYPYDTLSNVQRIIELFTGNEEAVFEAALRDGVLDIGCQDGELSFLFESLGCQVTAIDNEATNHNGLRGLNALSGQLGSSVRLHQIDLDTPFSFPQKKYGLTIFLGVLYHLKNPFRVMELLARHSTYCVCSTRLMRCLPDGSTIPAHSPIAYLLEAYELNDDNSNYWILSESALQRILSRTGWGVSAFFTVGDRETSDPVSIARDERAFCLLRSRYGMGHLKLIDGWHEPEQSGWRWTKREFSIGLPAGYRQRITMRLFIPPFVFERLGLLTLRASLGGVELRPTFFDRPGEHVYARPLEVPCGSGSSDGVMHFHLDKALAAGNPDPRELGIIIASVDIS